MESAEVHSQEKKKTGGPKSGAKRIKSGGDLAQFLDAEEVIVRKGLADCMPRRFCDVYVTLRTNFKAQLERCQVLLDKETCSSTEQPDYTPAFVWIHGLGNALARAINLALQLQTIYPGLVVSPHTTTVKCKDEVETFKGPNGASTVQEKVRPQSAIHIKVCFPDKRTSATSAK